MSVVCVNVSGQAIKKKNIHIYITQIKLRTLAARRVEGVGDE